MQNKTNNSEPTRKHNTTLIISLSIFVGLLIFILIISSAGFLFIKYINQQKSNTPSNVKKWQETLNGLVEEPIVTVPSEEQDKRKQNVGKIGQTISNEILDLQISSLEKINLKSSQPAKDNEFYKVDFSIKNNTDQDQVISLLDFSLLDPSDGEFSLVIPSKNEASDLLEQETNLKAGEKVTKNLIFEIKQNVKKADFVFDDDIDTKIIIKLEK